MSDESRIEGREPQKQKNNPQQPQTPTASSSTGLDIGNGTTAPLEEHTICKAIIDSSAHGILVLDKAGTVLHFNDKFRKLWDVPSKMLPKASALELIEHIADQLQGSKEDLERFKKLPASRQSYSETLLLKDNRMVRCQCTTLTSGNAELGRIANFRDISEQIRLEIAVRESEEKYSSFVRDFNGIAYKADLVTWTPLFFHGAVKEITGYSEADFIKGSPRWDQVIHPEDLSSNIVNSVKRLREEPNFATEREYRIVCKDGRVKWVQELTQNICDDSGKPAYCQGVIYDITDKRKMEQELIRTSKLESVGMLAGGIAHDFNNLLTAIVGNLSLAKDKIHPDDDAMDNLHRARRACSHAKDLTKQLLTFSKGGALVKKTARISQLIRDSAVMAVRGSKVRCKFGISSELWPVEVDEGQIKQAINNLVLNARQSMWGGGTIEVTAQNASLGGRDSLPIQQEKCVEISVADNGVGIHAKHLNKIFDPYFTTKANGTGLGLATTHSIVQQHGGHITVESELGIGTTFHIFLPASKDKVSGEASKQKSAGRHQRVLVLDDEELVRQVISEMLEIAGYEPEFAEDGEKAIKLFKRAVHSEQPFDAVILDLTIPGGIGGKEVIEELIKIDPQVKAIVSSGYSDDPVLSDHKQYGFIGCVTKPYEFEELRKVLDDITKD
jgi:PAS domain S-box-containing protein